MVEKQILNGMKEISAAVGRSEASVLDIKRHYPSMPMRKMGRVWTSERAALLEWWHSYAMGEVQEVECGAMKGEGRDAGAMAG